MASGFTPPHLKKTAFDLKQLTDGVAVITGSGSGIGNGVARHCALQLGMRVCVVDIRGAAAEAAAEAINDAAGGVVAVGIEADVTSDESMAALPGAIADAWPGASLRLVHANAGVWPKPGVLEGSTMADWDFTCAEPLSHLGFHVRRTAFTFSWLTTTRAGFRSTLSECYARSDARADHGRAGRARGSDHHQLNGGRDAQFRFC